MNQLGSNIVFIMMPSKIKVFDEVMFMMNHNMLIRIKSVFQKESEDNTKVSFIEGSASNGASDNKNGFAGRGADKKEKIVKRQIVVCYYSAEEMPGDFTIVSNLVKNHVEKCILENFSKLIRRMNSMRSDSILAKYFLSEDSKEYRIQLPKVNDKTTLLFLLKNNLHQNMNRVTCSADHHQRQDYGRSFVKGSFVGNADDYVMSLNKASIKPSTALEDTGSAEKEDKFNWLSFVSKYII